MSTDGCSGQTINDFLNNSEKKHQEYCNEKGDPWDFLNPCLPAEGCYYDDNKPDGQKCDLDTNNSIGSAYMTGGFGFGKLCLDKEFTRLILLFLFPPLYIFIKEREKGFTNKSQIILSFIYTSIFYVPGVIHALVYKHTM